MLLSRSANTTLNLRAGDLVEVRSREEILATLDRDGSIDGLPFMPEMLAFCGQRFTVDKRADKTCDTISQSGMRRMKDAVHLEGTRCTGSAHGGCEAACQIFWKESWLKRVDASTTTKNGRALPVLHALCTQEMLDASARQAPADDGELRYRCQATDLLKATVPLPRRDVMQHVRDLRSGNVGLVALLKGLAWWVARYGRYHWPGYRAQIWLFNTIQKLRGGTPLLNLPGTQTRTPTERLDLKPGEWVEVKDVEEIRNTLDPAQKNRGLYFDLEMTPYCGTKQRVRSRVNRIIDEKTGKMLNIPGSCVILEGAVCSGRYHLSCPRAIFPYWREIWLKRLEEPGVAAALAEYESSAATGATCGTGV